MLTPLNYMLLTLEVLTCISLQFAAHPNLSTLGNSIAGGWLGNCYNLYFASRELPSTLRASLSGWTFRVRLRYNLMETNLLTLRRSGFYPGIHYMLGSWYTPREIGKRAMIFWLAGSIGQMFSGFLQAAAYKNLNGVHGHEGWRWLFIIDGIITIPLAVMGYVFFPNLPQGGIKTWWTTQSEHELSVSRLKAIGRAGKQPWTLAKVKKIAFSWHTWTLRKY